MGLISEGVELLNLVDKAKNADLYKQLGDWISKVEQLQKDKETLTEKVHDLSDRVRFKGKLEYIAGHTYVEGLDQEICPRCADVDHRPVRMMDMNIDGKGMKATCPQCKTTMGKMNPPMTRQRAEQSVAKRLAAS